MTDAGIDGERFPYTFWISDETDDRLDRLSDALDISADQVLELAVRIFEDTWWAILCRNVGE